MYGVLRSARHDTGTRGHCTPCRVKTPIMSLLSLTDLQWHTCRRRWLRFWGLVSLYRGSLTSYFSLVRPPILTFVLQENVRHFSFRHYCLGGFLLDLLTYISKSTCTVLSSFSWTDFSDFIYSLHRSPGPTHQERTTFVSYYISSPTRKSRFPSLYLQGVYSVKRDLKLGLPNRTPIGSTLHYVTCRSL